MAAARALEKPTRVKAQKASEVKASDTMCLEQKVNELSKLLSELKVKVEKYEGSAAQHSSHSVLAILEGFCVLVTNVVSLVT